jgi:hypothetical protein
MTELEITCASCGRKITVAGDKINPVLLCSCGAKTKYVLGKFPEREFRRAEFATSAKITKMKIKDLPYNQVTVISDDD